MPVVGDTTLPFGVSALSIAISLIGAAEVSILAITCDGKKVGRRATWSTNELAHVFAVGLGGAALILE